MRLRGTYCGAQVLAQTFVLSLTSALSVSFNRLISAGRYPYMTGDRYTQKRQLK